MFDEVFKRRSTVERYWKAPYAESRVQFLKKASEDGYSRSMLKRIAWALLVVAETVNLDAGPVTAKKLEKALRQRARYSVSTNSSDTECTRQILLHFGKAWLRSVGAFTPDPEPPSIFAVEVEAFMEHMRVERGLSPVTIRAHDECLRWFFASLPPDIRTLGEVTVSQIDHFLDGQACRGWTRRSLRALASCLRSFFRYAAHQGWCSINLERGIELPRVYALADVPRAPTVEEVKRVLNSTSSKDDPVKIRDHAVLLLLVLYGLRRGEVERLTLDDLDWVEEQIHITRPKIRRAQCYPLLAVAGDAILRYLRQARPRCSHRALFITIDAPFRPLSGRSVSAMVRKRLTEQGVQLQRRGAHCLRHACAGQLLDAGFTLKQIADHLGHRSMNTTRIYTKIDLHGLREVAEFDIGGLR
jgi:site-specific recombinase XerD